MVRQEDAWGLLASWSKQMSEFQIRDRPCLKRKGAKPLEKDEDHQWEPVAFRTHTHLHTHVHRHTKYKERKK